MVAFSVGGSLALSAAADPAIADKIDPLILFGPAYDIAEIQKQVIERFKTPPRTDLDWDDLVWFEMITVYPQPEAFGLSAKERGELNELLAGYCNKSVAKKKDFYNRVLKGRDIKPDLSGNEASLRKVSPAGKLAGVTSRVFIIHDPADTMVAPEQSEKIMAELNSKRPAGRQELLVTPLVSHVNAHASWRVLDFFQICGMMGELYR